jgi:4-hydroxy-3-methylbut-2-enyl diphosphate reductase
MTILLANPRAFCAGVRRAISIVEEAIAHFGPPVYVRHQIVHNQHVIAGLVRKGAVFVESLDDVPPGSVIIFSAHGVPAKVHQDAVERGLLHIDATCPLVTKVHREISRYHKTGHSIVLIGHAGHQEVIGTMGQLPPGAVTLVENVEDVARLGGLSKPFAYCTQTTLSVDDAKDIIAALKSRFPDAAGPDRNDICYATTNRQTAVKAISARADAVLVIGSANSSNTMRLLEVAGKSGVGTSLLLENADDIPWRAFADAASVGIAAGASTPESLVEEVIGQFRQRYATTIEEVVVAEEHVEFQLPSMPLVA